MSLRRFESPNRRGDMAFALDEDAREYLREVTPRFEIEYPVQCSSRSPDGRRCTLSEGHYPRLSHSCYGYWRDE